MATKARQQYFADEDSLQKIRREFSIADDIQQKIDSIEPWAQVNKIETVKVNWTALVPDANKAVNVEVPEVIDNLYTVDSDNALSAKQWKLLYDYIQNIASRWRFLSNWNSATGLPMTNPSESPYPYKSWDYFIVSNMAWLWGTNYRPDGSSYIIWQASTVVETDSVDVSDFYFYDGTNWLLLSNSGRSIAVDSSLSTTSTNPVENRVVTNAINSKADATDVNTKTFHLSSTSDLTTAQEALDWYLAGKNPVITYDTDNVNSLNRTYILHDWNSDFLEFRNSSLWYYTHWQSSTALHNDWIRIYRDLVDDTVVSSISKNDVWTYLFLSPGQDYQTPYVPTYDWSPATKKYVDDHAGQTYTAWTNIQISAQNVISATDTTYTAWTWINIDANNVISNTQTSAQWWNITWTLSNQTDLQSALDSKVNLWMNKVFDSTVVEIWKWEHEPGGDSSGHHIELDPNWEISTYNLTQAWHNEATLWSGTLELLNSTVLDWNKTATFDHEKIVADDWTNTNTYNFFWNDRIAKLSDLSWKQDTLTASTGISIDSSNNISNTLPWPTIAATAPTGTEWALWYDTTNDVLMAHDWTVWKEAWTQMKVLSYGHSTWQDFIDAYNENAIVYCKTSSNANPWSWTQWRMAFMAFIDINSSTQAIQGVEFQYYRSRSSHSTAANVLDEVYIYKLTPASGWTWTVTQRDTAAKPIAWTWIWLTYNASGMTISADTTVLATKTDLNSKQDTLVSWTNIKTINSNSLLGSWNLTLNDVKVSATAPSSPTEWMAWYDSTNDVLKTYDWSNWNATGKEYNAGEWIEIWDSYSAMQWTAPAGFHVPLNTEWQAVYDVWTALWGWSSDWTNFWIALKLPFAGTRYYNDSNVYFQGTGGYYWSSSPYPSNANYSYYLYFNSSSVYPQSSYYRAYGFSVRCFKNKPVIPTSSWTKLYWTSIEAGWIFWSSTDWLISLSSNWTTWITIADKNLWATTVWNSWDTLSEANCWKYYQRWNNYWFPRTWTVTTSSTQVDASTYWPWNYYSSNTFITYSWAWDSTGNGNLWWWVTWVISNAITNTGVLSVNGQTWDVTISTWLQESPNSTITGIKYIRHWTEADYANLNQYYTDTPWDTEFHCF